MPTVLEVLTKTTEFLGRKGVPQPKLESEWLLAHALGCRRLDLFLRFDQPLSESQLEPLREQVARRGRREPLHYIFGRTTFLDFEVACDRRALIPRPETEELASLLLAKVTTPPTAALDLGTGTGVLAFAMARHWPGCRVVAVEASLETLALARANAAALALETRLQFVHAPWPEVFQRDLGRFAVVVSNPPYLTEAEWAGAEPEVREWEPRGALVAANGGLADLHEIITHAPACLESGGVLALETGIEHHAALNKIAEATQVAGKRAYAHTESLRDLSKRDRFFLAWRA